jgi:hypothetical protein
MTFVTLGNAYEMGVFFCLHLADETGVFFKLQLVTFLIFVETFAVMEQNQNSKFHFFLSGRLMVVAKYHHF